MTCKNKCGKYKADQQPGKGRYASGQKRCFVCEIFMIWDGTYCPCCGFRLATKPRTTKSRQSYRNHQEKAGIIKRIEK